MACPDCQRRSALIAALAPAISDLSLTRDGLLELLALSNEQLLRAVEVENPDELLRGLQVPLPSERVPTALCRHEHDYPEALRQLPSAPAVLYATCTVKRLRELLCKPTVAIVGERQQTGYACEITFALARDLAGAGVTVISGLYKDLEAIAHRGALDAEGQTIAVMPCTPEHSYPSAHEHLHLRVLARGAAISELPPGFSLPQQWCLFAGQRILAALARTVVIVEARGRSSALFTAQIAAGIGHDIAVVPGRVTDPGAIGTFALLRYGAHPVACAQDVLDLIGMVHTTEHRARRVAA